ncbi:MAG: hypothetical protein WCC80_14775, partial [Pseudolabrys sp.]
LFLPIRMGCPRCRSDKQPCTYDENNSGYGAIARDLRLQLQPRYKRPKMLQDLASRTSSLCERYSELATRFGITAK